MKLGEVIKQLTELEKIHGSDIELRIEAEEDRPTIQEINAIETNTIYLSGDGYINEAEMPKWRIDLFNDGNIEELSKLKAVFLKGVFK